MASAGESGGGAVGGIGGDGGCGGNGGGGAQLSGMIGAGRGAWAEAWSCPDTGAPLSSPATVLSTSCENGNRYE
jgi:hypothetical protein